MSTAPVSDVTIARGTAADLDAVIGVMDAAFDDRFGEAWTRSQCAGILSMPGVRLIVARLGSLVAGFALSRTIADEAELLLLAVDPSLRRRGIGLTLLNHFIESARAAGASRVHLEVREGNPAVSMYRKAGFGLAGRRANYYHGRFGGNFDALTLSRDL